MSVYADDLFYDAQSIHQIICGKWISYCDRETFSIFLLKYARNRTCLTDTFCSKTSFSKKFTERSRWYPFNVQMQKTYTRSQKVNDSRSFPDDSRLRVHKPSDESKFIGRSGRVGIWTPGLGVANAALFRLSYAPLTLSQLYYVWDIFMLILWRLYGSLKWPIDADPFVYNNHPIFIRRWSSRRFPYGYLVTT